MTNDPKTSKVVKAAQGLFFLNAAIWLVIGIISIARMYNNNSMGVVIMGIIAAFMFGNVAAMIVSSIGLGKEKKSYYFLAFFVIVINILLTITDQFGLIDLITLILDLVILGVLIVIRKNYFPN